MLDTRVVMISASASGQYSAGRRRCGHWHPVRTLTRSILWLRVGVVRWLGLSKKHWPRPHLRTSAETDWSHLIRTLMRKLIPPSVIGVARFAKMAPWPMSSFASRTAARPECV